MEEWLAFLAFGWNVGNSRNAPSMLSDSLPARLVDHRTLMMVLLEAAKIEKQS